MHHETASIPTPAGEVEGTLDLPTGATGVVLFAHGSGSSRFSPRNNFVAGALRTAGIGTLLMDLLTPAEDDVYRTRFNIGLLTERLGLAADWLAASQAARGLPLGLFGASTGAAAALQLAAERREGVAAVVSLRQPCSSSAAATRVSSNSTNPPSSIFIAKNASTSCPGQPICSRSPGRWKKWHAWHGTGSRSTFHHEW
jgi:putative phosphoribosyl transferase